jgi:sterol desaturase/sphingolipid hydroxylase (fatty acid hydroxylase superfamily)
MTNEFHKTDGRSHGGDDVGAPVLMPPLYRWPPPPLAILRWIWTGVLYPWGLFFLGLAIFSWQYLTPSLETMASFSLDWIGLIWLRNAALLFLIAMPLHWWLYQRRGQDASSKLNPSWQPQTSGRFLFRSQLKDNMFWSLASGCTIWSLYEAFTFWLYANSYLDVREWSDSKGYLAGLAFLTFFASWAHFYFVHRLLHVPVIYRLAHALHHRNNSPQPWSGISMHPLEHVLYFSIFAMFWWIPTHPALIIMLGFFQGIGPAISHCGFEEIRFGKRIRIPSGDPFHQLHHKYYEVNYGNKPAPFDKLFGSWHDGTESAKQAFRARRREQAV